MKVIIRTLACALFLTGLMSINAAAQFEGQIQMALYGDDENGNPETSYANLFVTKDRIMLKGEESMKMNDMMDAEGILVRHDMRDFVLMMGNNKALQITKAEIESLIQTFSGWSQGSRENTPSEDDMDYKYTNRTRTINGYECTEMVVTSKEEPGKSLSIWLTPDIQINWGILKEPWKNLPKDIENGVNNIGRDVVFSGKNFPMLIEENGGSESKVIMEVSNVNESSIAKAMVEIPAGMKLVSMKEFMFDMMMQQ
ncbi:DUF4412 domain-containing protein [Balneola sp. MJW-20]|uniref:DUF4412 domain-containing protein n=1 Tax=Gracilimonas aurantiaca TaxID=3234185 RepID=UPI003466B6E0